MFAWFGPNRRSRGLPIATVRWLPLRLPIIVPQARFQPKQVLGSVGLQNRHTCYKRPIKEANKMNLIRDLFWNLEQQQAQC